jgi:hypothetical protein
MVLLLAAVAGLVIQSRLARPARYVEYLVAPDSPFVAYCGKTGVEVYNL